MVTGFGLMLKLSIDERAHLGGAHPGIVVHRRPKCLKGRKQLVSLSHVSLSSAGNKLPYRTTGIPCFLTCLQPKIEAGPFVFHEDCLTLFTWSSASHRIHHKQIELWTPWKKGLNFADAVQ
jgi:hypothetical protein